MARVVIIGGGLLWWRYQPKQLGGSNCPERTDCLLGTGLQGIYRNGRQTAAEEATPWALVICSLMTKLRATRMDFPGHKTPTCTCQSDGAHRSGYSRSKGIDVRPTPRDDAYQR